MTAKRDTQKAAYPNEPRGAVFTRPEVVEFILDLAGYTPDCPIEDQRVLEPSFGEGDFLVPIVRRLMDRYTRIPEPERPTPEALRDCIRAVELDETYIQRTQERLEDILTGAGLSLRDTKRLLKKWLIHGDFLLQELPFEFDYSLGNPPYVRQELIPEELIREYRKRFTTIYDRADLYVYDRADLYVPFIEKSLKVLAPGGTLGFICAPETISGIGGVLDRLGATRAMVVCGPSILSHSDVVHRVQEALGGRESGLFSGIAPHSPVEVLYEAVAMARELEPDALVSVGGGSTSDTCKGIAMMLAEGGDLHDYEVRFQPPDLVIVPDLPHQKIPLIAVPTTLGAAELSTGGGGFTDKKLGRKILISGQGTLPKTILVDGRALATTPMPIMLSTAIGQFRIAVEGIYSTGHHPIADALALHTIKMLVEYLPQCRGGDVDSLLHAKTAACMVMLARPGLGLNTAIAHQLGGLYDVPHGEANSVLLPHTMRFNMDSCASRLAMVAQAMGIETGNMTDEDAALAAADGVAQLCRSLDLPETLRDVGVPEEGLELIASATLHDRGLATNPKPVYDAGPIMTVLRAAW